MNHFFAFVGISLGVLVFPGPSILLIVANSLQRGRFIGLCTVFGGIVAMGVQLAVALVGISSVFASFSSAFNTVRWAGALYLLYLGVQRWRGLGHSELRGRPARDYGSAVLEGFVVALTNPGTMLFFVAFFPQFLNETLPVPPQLGVMAVTFLLLSVAVDCSYALLAARIGRSLHQPGDRPVRNRMAGAILVLAAVTLAVLNV